MRTIRIARRTAPWSISQDTTGPRGFHVTIPGLNSAAYDSTDVVVDIMPSSEHSWDSDAPFRVSVGWFETREEAIAFAREVFEPLGYSVDY